MSAPIITIENLGKKYRLDHQIQRQRYTALRDVLADKVRRLLQLRFGERSSSDSVGHQRTEEFWALSDVSFEIKPGEVVGIIGRNGAGKSTLLKILSQITEPTTGRVCMRGRVASLLEVGTGFHPELTGRENIYLNGAILGMSRAEIRRKFDEIVAFAEVEQFLDTPVKRYSSGMYVRLAFGVAAHLEPEILVVDEVLAVGDAQFQKKCLGKMEDVAKKDGRTILFVSHNMSAVQALCGTGVLLDRGRLCRTGPILQVIGDYSASLRSKSGEHTDGIVALGPVLQLSRLEIQPRSVSPGGPMSIDIQLFPKKATAIKELAFLIYSDHGARVAIIDLRRKGFSELTLSNLPIDLRIDIRSLPLIEGDYLVGLYVVTSDHCGNHLDLDTFSVLSSQKPGDVVPYPAHYRGFVELEFSVEHSLSTETECLTL